MTTVSFLLTEEQLLCGVCLKVFTDPSSLPCGHNFCKTCVPQHREDAIECPSCKELFHSRVDLKVNPILSDLASQFRQSVGRSSSPAAGPGDVCCDICTRKKTRATRSCLVCLASYCEHHLKSHLTVPCLRRHQLTDPVENLESMMCATHDKPLELFCSTDQTYVCMLCPVLDHKSHEFLPLKEQYEKKKVELESREEEIRQKIQERRSKIQDLNHSLKLNKGAANNERSSGVQVFMNLIQSLERVWTELNCAVRVMQVMTETEAKGFIQELKQEISELLKSQAEMEQLSKARDYLQFLQNFEALKATDLTRDWAEVRVDVPSYRGIVRRSVDELEQILGQELRKPLHECELIRAQKFAVDLTLDPDTAHPALILSEDGKRVYHGAVRKNLPDNPRRFNPSCCVLAEQWLSSGKFYFEVDVREKTRWTLGVAKESIKRKGIISMCPENGHWTMWLKNSQEYAALIGSPLPISVNTKPQTVGVFVDYEEGVVSFYDVDTAALLYLFAGCSFTGKLYPFFSPGLNYDGANSAPMIIASHDEFAD